MITIHNKATKFLDELFSQLEKSNIQIGNWEIDHLCYRTSSEENYLKTKDVFEEVGKCLIESEVNGRNIATFKLFKPIVYQNWIIDLIEVPAPKPQKITPEGFEHIEVVVDKDFNTLMSQYPHLSFEQQGLEKELNPELEVELRNCAIKFHHKSLEHIINIENHKLVTNFLKESDILSLLKEFTPCLSGTIPLGIENPQSDLDILFYAQDLYAFLTKAQEHFQEMEQFSYKIDESHAVVHFCFNHLQVELFCQSTPVFQQEANQHFLIEGRLLKLLGNDFKQKVIELKTRGIKTEPAFGKLLKLSKPYEDLIALNKLSDLELLNRFKEVL